MTSYKDIFLGLVFVLQVVCRKKGKDAFKIKNAIDLFSAGIQLNVFLRKFLMLLSIMSVNDK